MCGAEADREGAPRRGRDPRAQTGPWIPHDIGRCTACEIDGEITNAACIVTLYRGVVEVVEPCCTGHAIAAAVGGITQGIAVRVTPLPEPSTDRSES